MYDRELVERLEQLKRTRLRTGLRYGLTFLGVLTIPAIVQEILRQLPYLNMALFFVVWILMLLTIVVSFIWKDHSLRRRLAWACSACQARLDYREIRKMVRFSECPFCGETFEDGRRSVGSQGDVR